MEEPNASEGINALKKIISGNPIITRSDGFLLIHHTDGLEPYEIEEIEILQQYDLIEKLKILEKKKWMTAEIARNLVEVHFRITPEVDPYQVRTQYRRNRHKE